MSKAGEVHVNPVTGERVVVRVDTEDSGGKTTVSDLYVRPGGAVVGEHLHPNFEERFTVVRGLVGFRLNGRGDVAVQGQELVVPPGTSHDWWNAGEDEAHVVVEVRGASVRFEVLILTLFGLARDDKTDAKGRPNLLQTALIAREFGDVVRFTSPPRVVQLLLFGALAPVARLLGYRPTYPEYLRRGPLAEKIPPATEKGRGDSAGYAARRRRPPVKRIETPRLDLWPLLPEDLAPMHRIWNDPLVRRYLWEDEPVSVAAARACVEGSEREFAERGLGLFGVCLRGETDLIGCCGFRSLEGTEDMELMYSLLPGWWDQGLATEAAIACLRYAFEEVGLERVVAGADAVNAASLRVIEKLGMQPIGNVAPGAPEAPYFALRREEFGGRELPSNLGASPETARDPEPLTHHDETPRPMGSRTRQPERGKEAGT